MMKWHEGEKWERLLKVYDGIARDMFHESKLVATRFGETQVHACGDPENPKKLVFFHGIATNSIMFGDWLFPALSKYYHCIAIDTVGDMGRSLPRDGDPANGPRSERELADWVVEVFQQLGVSREQRRRPLGGDDGTTTSVDVVGYSLGSFIASCVARYYPDEVDKLILMAPVGVLAPVRKLWLAQAISFAMISQFIPQNGYLAAKLRLWFFGSMMADTACMENLKYPELREATDAVGSPKVQIQPVVWDTETLREVTEVHPTLMIIGQQENVLDSKQAIDNARKSNMRVIVYENAGHMFFCEYPKDIVANEIRAFLSG